MKARRLFLVLLLLLLANAAHAGTGAFQRTKDGKTLVWNNNRESGDEVTWSGGRDSRGFAAGEGKLTWYKIQGKIVTGSRIAETRGRGAFLSRYAGKMVRGRFEGLVVAVDADGKTVHGLFVKGSRAGLWVDGPAPTRPVHDEQAHESPSPGPVVAAPAEKREIRKAGVVERSAPGPISPAVRRDESVRSADRTGIAPDQKAKEVAPKIAAVEAPAEGPSQKEKAEKPSSVATPTSAVASTEAGSAKTAATAGPPEPAGRLTPNPESVREQAAQHSMPKPPAEGPAPEGKMENGATGRDIEGKAAAEALSTAERQAILNAEADSAKAAATAERSEPDEEITPTSESVREQTAERPTPEAPGEGPASEAKAKTSPLVAAATSAVASAEADSAKSAATAERSKFVAEPVRPTGVPNRRSTPDSKSVRQPAAEHPMPTPAEVREREEKDAQADSAKVAATPARSTLSVPKPAAIERPTPGIENSVRSLVVAPAPPPTDRSSNVPPQLSAPSADSPPASGPRLTAGEAIALADAEVRAHDYNVDQFPRPTAQYAAASDSWSVSYEQTYADGMRGKHVGVSVDDKTKKASIVGK